MICVSIQGKSLTEIYDILDREDVEMAEIRLDLCDLDEEEREELFSTTDKPLIATCRSSQSLPYRQAEEILLQAVEDGATYVDLELEAPVTMSKRIVRACKDGGIPLIRSCHDYEGTPSIEELRETMDRCRRYGGDIVKIVTTATSTDDWERVSELYKDAAAGSLVAFCMGTEGRESRFEALKLGSPWTYAALSQDDATASGQWSLPEINTALYGERRRLRRGDLQMPASKSFAQRAIIAAALAEGTSLLHGYSSCSDTDSALDVARALGARVTLEGRDLSIKGVGTRRALHIDSINTGESGLLTRLMIPLLAQLNAGSDVRVDGRGTLLRRPLESATDIMASFGVMLTNAEQTGAKDVKVPVRISGHLMPGRADISGKGGSQLISGLLMALPLADSRSTIFVHEPKSIPYMFITVDVLKQFGIEIGTEMEGDDEFIETQDWAYCSSVNFHIKGGQTYHAAEIDLEQDWSSAANFMVAGAIYGEVSIPGLDTKSLQADITILDVLANAGACVSEDEDGTVNVYKAPLTAFDADLSNAPDLFPIVSILSAFAAGESHILGMSRLAGKESNRSEGIMNMLTQLGVEAQRSGDELIVRGETLSQRLASRHLLRGGSYTSAHDHRMVMALKVASLCADSPIVIDDEECVSKSFPDFIKQFS